MTKEWGLSINLRLAVGSRGLAVGSWKLAVGTWRLAFVRIIQLLVLWRKALELRIGDLISIFDGA